MGVFGWGVKQVEDLLKERRKENEVSRSCSGLKTFLDQQTSEDLRRFNKENEYGRKETGRKK